MQSDVTIVIMTRNRADDLRATLSRLIDVPGALPIIVVDNGSTDGTVHAVRRDFPQVEVVPLGFNAGVAARNEGVRRASTPYVAFADDDSWWAPDALEWVTAAFDRHPTLGAVIAHVIVEPAGTDDPVSSMMRDSPLDGDPALPGIPVLGFLACAAAVRRRAYLEVGGFDARLHFAGEEALLAADLAASGWAVRYLPEVRVHHQPASRRAPTLWRQRREVRNALWTLWLRRPIGAALRGTVRLLADANPRAAAGGFAQATGGLPWVVRDRRVVPSHLEEQLQRLDADTTDGVAVPETPAVTR